LKSEAARLKAAIYRRGVLDGAEGAGGAIFAANVNARGGDFVDVPPGSLMKLPALGFISEDDPLFRRTYAWLHSTHYAYSYADQPFGLPGSYRLPFTTSWAVADHLRLTAGRAQALKILKQSPWDGGIITEGVKADSGIPDREGRAFATAAGYMAHTICRQFCIERKVANRASSDEPDRDARAAEAQICKGVRGRPTIPRGTSLMCVGLNSSSQQAW
jgi:meiotically up-regulated gene 157 (Mug157) protein